MNANMWQLFIDGLAQTGILAVDPATFKAASGLAIADWEVINYTGLPQPPPAPTPGTTVPSSIYSWADPIPGQVGRFYQPGSSLSDSYAMFLNSLLVPPADAATIAQARNNLSQYQMTDSAGQSWPGYGITPGLNNFLLASLQSIMLGRPPQIDFTVPAPVGAVTSAVPSARDTVNFTNDPPFFGVDNEPVALDQAALRERTFAADSGAAIAGGSAAATGGSAAAASIRFQAQTAQMFSVQPWRWFSASTVSMFATHVDPASALANKAIFGPTGFLNGRASQILVAFRRVVTVSGQPALVDSLQHSLTGATRSFNLGAFHFSVDSAQTLVTQDDPGTIIFQDNTNAPAVLGIAVDVLQ